MTRAQREATAYHEAGHVVISWCLRCKPKSATIVAGDGSFGRVTYEDPFGGMRLDLHSGGDRLKVERHTRLKVERPIMIALGGPLAQQHHRPSSWRRHHGASDFRQVAEMALAFSRSSEPANAFIARLELRTKGLVAIHWNRIRRVASALLERNTLNRDDIETLTKS